MNNFEAYNPTRIIFGTKQEFRIRELLKDLKVNRVLITYGGGSIKKNGVYDRVIAELANFEVFEFGGIEANPEFSTLIKAVETVKKNQIDFILAIGGGSVIDGTKFISGASTYDGDPWEVLLRVPGKAFQKAIPFGTVLTLPATGSEANSGAVISRSELNEKRTMGGPQFFPVFSICNPEVVATLPKRQIANGIVDAFMHTLEQYLTYPTWNILQERQAEAILSTLIEVSEKVIANPSDIDAAGNLMWCATQALNGSLRSGVAYDWCTHMIGHELTAFYGIDHARTLAIIAPRLYEAMYDDKREKLIQYGRRVWQLQGSDDEIALQSIQQTEAFFNGLGIPTKVSEYTSETQDLALKIKSRFEERGWVAMGEKQAITPEIVERIVEAAI